MTSVVKVALARRFFCRAYTTDSPGQLSFKDRSGRGTRPIPRLDPVPRPHVISCDRNSLQTANFVGPDIDATVTNP